MQCTMTRNVQDDEQNTTVDTPAVIFDFFCHYYEKAIIQQTGCYAATEQSTELIPYHNGIEPVGMPPFRCGYTKPIPLRPHSQYATLWQLARISQVEIACESSIEEGRDKHPPRKRNVIGTKLHAGVCPAPDQRVSVQTGKDTAVV